MARKNKLPQSLTTVTTFSKLLAMVLFILLPFAGFYIGVQYQKKTNSVSSNIISSSKIDTKIDVNSAGVGDVIGGMKIVKIASFVPKMTNLSLEQNVQIDFEGEITITGKTDFTGPPLYGTNISCFDTDKDRLPYIDLSLGGSFCFSNQDFAKQYFAPNKKGEIKTITIDKYKLISYPSEGFNTAELVRVIK